MGGLTLSARLSRTLLFCLVLLAMTRCGGGREIRFSSAEPGSTISVVSLDNPEGVVPPSPNPLLTQAGKLNGKVVRVSAVGKASQFWFPPDDSAKRIDVKIKSLSACAQGDGNRNRPLRLLLKAYQALTAKDYNLARELCKKASEVDATLAAPFIITGLSYLQEGKKEPAWIALNKARALDPEDTDIAELLRLAQ